MNLCPVTMDVHEKARLPHEETKEKEGNDYEEIRYLHADRSDGSYICSMFEGSGRAEDHRGR